MLNRVIFAPTNRLDRNTPGMESVVIGQGEVAEIGRRYPVGTNTGEVMIMGA